MKFTEQYFPVVPVNFVMLYKVVIILESVYEILKFAHLNESYWAALSCDTVYYAEQGGSVVLSVCMKSYGVTIQIKATEQYFPVVLFIMLYKVVLTFESEWDDQVWPFKWKQPRSTFLW